jgi:diguanylate cyclase (GGDEF)-like protein
VTPEFPLLQLASPLTGVARNLPRIDESTSIRAAAKVAATTGSGGVVVQRRGEDYGLVTNEQLLLELSADKDPLTGLPRSGALRDWLTEKLTQGHEVAVAFIDLDDFGQINRNAGHPAGDEALLRAAGIVHAGCSPPDYPSRFGGDEFAIASLRERDELVRTVAQIGRNLEAEGLPASIGIAGGRRRKARTSHVQSTVEELLRLASTDCLLQKRNRNGVHEEG